MVVVDIDTCIDWRNDGKALQSSFDDSFSLTLCWFVSPPKDNAKKEKIKRKVRMPTATRDFGAIEDCGVS